MGWQSCQSCGDGDLLRYGQVDVSVLHVQEECVFKSLKLTQLFD
jgi:hypothetical protein